jgi:hypothetical protein
MTKEWIVCGLQEKREIWMEFGGTAEYNMTEEVDVATDVDRAFKAHHRTVRAQALNF